MPHKGYHDIDTVSVPFFATDLAVEAHEYISQGNEIPGISKEAEEIENVKIERVFVKDMVGAQAINKAPGNYTTIYAPGLRTKDTPLRKSVSKIFAKEFSKFMNGLDDKASILVVGLGNANATPDAIGPAVTDNLLVSRHYFQVMPDKVEQGFRPVSTIAPGVMGQTGIETSDYILGVVQQIKPDAVVVIDALASRSIERINTTIQIADSGINPGAGVGNNRKAINKETLGIPVIAVGVPTVVDAVTIVHDTMEYVATHIKDNGTISMPMPPAPGVSNASKNQQINRNPIKAEYESLSEEQKKQLINHVLKAEGHQFMVTPKEIDTYIDEMANVIAGGLNAALHQKISIEDAAMYT